MSAILKLSVLAKRSGTAETTLPILRLKNACDDTIKHWYARQRLLSGETDAAPASCRLLAGKP
jgi:hypothetical protein